jgi:mannose-1-phosphate guanylyltransferase
VVWQAPLNMASSNCRQAWAVVLAGGDGTRLQELTRRISGDSRPKQFCPLFGGKSLLLQTRERILPLFRQERTMLVVTRAHEAFYRGELLDVDESRIVLQPGNRGTAAAIALSLLRIAKREGDALVAFFPCDHYYANDAAFIRIVDQTMESVREHRKSIFLVGAEAHYPEIEYGWIETGPTIPNAQAIPLLAVHRFWEKPSLRKARSLWRRGCLWNTFVTIGRAAAFLEALQVQLPDVLESLTSNDLDSAYRELVPADFSREVLTPLAHRLLVVRDTASGWADLGNPNRVIQTLVRNSIEPAWLADAQGVSPAGAGVV